MSHSPPHDPICVDCHGRMGYPNNMTHHGAPHPCRCARQEHKARGRDPVVGDRVIVDDRRHERNGERGVVIETPGQSTLVIEFDRWRLSGTHVRAWFDQVRVLSLIDRIGELDAG